MPQLLALARDLDRIELIDLPARSRQVIITDTGPHPDGVVCDGTTVFWTTMGERTSINSAGEAVYADIDGGVHAIDVDGSNRRDIAARMCSNTTRSDTRRRWQPQGCFGSNSGRSSVASWAENSTHRGSMRQTGSRGTGTPGDRGTSAIT